MHPQAVLKANPGMKSSSKRPNLLMTAGIGVTERDEKKEHLYSLMGEPALLSSFSCASAFAKAQVVGTETAVVACCDARLSWRADTYIKNDILSIEESIVNHVEYTMARSRYKFDDQEAYMATAYSLRDRLIESWNDTQAYFK
jgi:hypothetical protein